MLVVTEVVAAGKTTLVGELTALAAFVAVALGAWGGPALALF
jgi:hypothetical protein